MEVFSYISPVVCTHGVLGIRNLGGGRGCLIWQVGSILLDKGSVLTL
jgi:hypothetical protein